MNDDVFREQILYRLGEMAAGQVALARAIEALAAAAGKVGRTGTLRVKIDAPPTKRRRKVRRT